MYATTYRVNMSKKDKYNNYQFECELSDNFFYYSEKHIFTKVNTASQCGMAIFIYTSGNSSELGLSYFSMIKTYHLTEKGTLGLLSHGVCTGMIGLDFSVPKNIEGSS